MKFSKKFFYISQKTIYNTLKNFNFLFETKISKTKNNIPVILFKSADLNFFLTLNNYLKNEHTSKNGNQSQCKKNAI